MYVHKTLLSYDATYSFVIVINLLLKSWLSTTKAYKSHGLYLSTNAKRQALVLIYSFQYSTFFIHFHLSFHLIYFWNFHQKNLNIHNFYPYLFICSITCLNTGHIVFVCFVSTLSYIHLSIYVLPHLLIAGYLYRLSL